MPEVLCSIHDEPMKQFWKKDDPDHKGQSWYSHKLENGTWCNGILKTNTNHAKTIAEYQKPDWDAINSRKEYNIARHVAYKAAVDLWIAGKIEKDQVWKLVADHTQKLTSEPETPPFP